MIIDILETDRVNQTKTVRPTFSHLFKKGDRVYCYHRHKRFAGAVVEVIRHNGNAPEKDEPEILMRTDYPVNLNCWDLLGGYGLRGEHYLFNFEKETREEEALHTRAVTIPLTPEDIKNLEMQDNLYATF